MTRPGAVVIGALARRALWRGAFLVSGGLHVSGRLPDGPCVVVANHSSHADTAALLAALPAWRRPTVAAAADYWFSRRPRAWLCRLLVSAFPVRRTGGGSADLESAASLVAAGRVVVVYPEGTRSRTGELGRFRSGAARLAERAGAPLVPVGISGARDLFPAHGRLRPARVAVRIGAPVADIAAAREAVARLAADRAPVADSGLRRRIALLTGSWLGLLLVAVWSLAEAVVWPLLPEVILAALVVAAPRRTVALTLTAATASLAGGALMYSLACGGMHPPAPLTTPRMHAAATAQVSAEGPAAMRHQPMSGIPYKVYGRAAGDARVDPGEFLVASATSRGVRIVGVGLAFGLFGAVAARWRRWYPAYLALFSITFTAGLAGVIRHWS